MYSFPFLLRNTLINAHAGPSLCSDSFGDVKRCSPGASSVFRKLILTSLSASGS